MLNTILVIGLAAEPQVASPLISLMPIVLIFIIFYILLIRPQQRQRKAHEDMISKLEKGDQVVTTGGIYGVIVGVKEKSVMLKIADNVKIEVQKNAVGYLKKAEGPSEET